MPRKKKNPKFKNKTVAVSITENDMDIWESLERVSRVTGLSKALVVKAAIRSYMKQLKKNGVISIYLPEMMENDDVGDEISIADDKKTEDTNNKKVNDSNKDLKDSKQDEDEEVVPMTDNLSKFMLNAGMDPK
ncbi:hypothetical protein [Ligilactobacillus salivarius]|uniref:Uncharacterized protein n=1 Tax=Ligilactobacillus salivarius TaxID=1624 RepID=A0A1V9R6H3_9LACO|nr:hypothetical protein [Ligilactobacillus salivarius]MBE5068018.1 hypothetical protein [Ligilactobacillus salivarius]OQQ88717.1 hypothetical protein B6U56_10685 [Ligilactobacillus salivarius]